MANYKKILKTAASRKGNFYVALLEGIERMTKDMVDNCSARNGREPPLTWQDFPVFGGRIMRLLRGKYSPPASKIEKELDEQIIIASNRLTNGNTQSVVEASHRLCGKLNEIEHESIFKVTG